MYWPLMEDAITLSDRMKMAWFVLTSSKLTNGPKVREFEEAWSRWLGIQHSLFVSSGSTANTLLVASMKELYGLKDGDKVKSHIVEYDMKYPVCQELLKVCTLDQLHENTYNSCLLYTSPSPRDRG